VALPPRGRGTATWGTRPTTELQNRCVVEAHWNDAPQQVRALYTKRIRTQRQVPSNAGTVKVGVNLRGPPRKAKYF
jgi:hypothetical protein